MRQHGFALLKMQEPKTYLKFCNVARVFCHTKENYSLSRGAGK